MRLGVLAVALVLFAPPLSAEPQQAGKIYRIGILSAGPLAPRAHQWDAFRRGLRELGYVEGRHLLLEIRAPKVEGGSHDELATGLVRLNVDIIVAATAPAILAAKRATSTIPIVMTTSTDAVAQGLVASLARPGGNVTGITMQQSDLSGKRLDLVREHRLPTVSGFGSFADAGGLLTYGASDTDNYRRAATYVDRILKGAKPAELPVEQPTAFELVINLKTAKALGLTMPPSLLLRADRIIE